MEEPAEITNTSLKLLKLRETEHSLEKSVSISIKYCLDSLRRLFWGLEIVECNVFTNSLIDTTIQDGGKREKSSVFINGIFDAIICWINKHFASCCTLAMSYSNTI